eukprot:snap_masked-scaffold_33-processed-gene-0.40-mRNA-1 protein AED:0.19 eAED:0.19 QI:0/-1/0/1/-1/1/1/0/105
MSQISLVGFLIFGEKIIASLRIEDQHKVQLNFFLNRLREQQIALFIGLFISSNVAQSLTATGAFEIEIDGRLAFSKLETGRLPNKKEVVALLSQFGIGSGEFVDV